MATEDAAGTPPDDTPELLVKLRERKERHKQRNKLYRIGVAVLGSLLVVAGLLLSVPGVPGPGLLVAVFGLAFLGSAGALLTRDDVTGGAGTGASRSAGALQVGCVGGAIFLFAAAVLIYLVLIRPSPAGARRSAP